MTGFPATVAGLTGSVERPTVGRSAVARDVTKLAAGVALHSLCLTVAGKVVRSTALVASSRTTALESAPEAAKSTTGGASATAHTSARVRAITGQVTSKTAGVASSAGAGAAQPKGWAVGLDVSKALAVVTLLCLGRTRVGATVRLVARLLAVVAEPLGR